MSEVKDVVRAACRRVLQETLESNYWFMSRGDRAVWEVVAELCELAEWSLDSYFVAGLFEMPELITEVGA